MPGLTFELSRKQTANFWQNDIVHSSALHTLSCVPAFSETLGNFEYHPGAICNKA